MPDHPVCNHVWLGEFCLFSVWASSLISALLTSWFVISGAGGSRNTEAGRVNGWVRVSRFGMMWVYRALRIARGSGRARTRVRRASSSVVRRRSISGRLNGFGIPNSYERGSRLIRGVGMKRSCRTERRIRADRVTSRAKGRPRLQQSHGGKITSNGMFLGSNWVEE